MHHDRQAQIAEFYASNAQRVRRAVARKANAPAEAVEDACATAWATLVRRDDVGLDPRGLNWLITVAQREAWRLTSTAHEAPIGTFQGGADDLMPEPTDGRAASVEERAITRADRVQAIRSLKPREREALFLKGAGYSYPEIAKATGSSYTAVNRRLSEGRARLRARARRTRRRAGGPARCSCRHASWRSPATSTRRAQRPSRLSESGRRLSRSIDTTSTKGALGGR